MDRLKSLLKRIDGRGYPSYKQIKGTYRADSHELDILHVQGDPFAAPSRIAVRISTRNLEVAKENIENRSRRMGLEDAYLRSVNSVLQDYRGPSRGSGKSGEWGILRPGQEILARTAVEIDNEELTLKMTLGLPAQGRRILGFEAITLLDEELPEIVEFGIRKADSRLLLSHMDSSEDQDQLRSELKKRNWIAFIANGSLLPRASGVDDRPLEQGAKPWSSPPEIEEEFTLPHRGKVKGSVIREGITLICGGGYHGKSTLLQALERGVYNHIPGDGRELCITRQDAVSVRAEDSRSICNVDISPFINDLPNGISTLNFSTANASGSTSQAANIVEAVEAGATALLIDEDTSATNFMVRDRRMQELVQTDCEPITPFIDRVRGLYDHQKISSILVVGGAGDYFEVADQVLVMNAYEPSMQTERAKEISHRFPSERMEETRAPADFKMARAPRRESFDPRKGRRSERVKTVKTRAINFGAEEIDLSLVSQLIDEGQTRTLGDWLLALSRGMADGQASLYRLSCEFEDRAQGGKLSSTTSSIDGNRVYCRRFELMAAINRLRSLKVERIE